MEIHPAKGGVMHSIDKVERARNLLARIAPTRPVWLGCDGLLLIAHTDDMRAMLEQLGVRTSA